MASSRIIIDGNDADVVYRTALAALDKARDGGGPSLIECLTYRHSGHSRADPAKYRPAGRARGMAEARSDRDLSRAAAGTSASAEETIEAIEADEQTESRGRDRGVQGLAAGACRIDDRGCLRGRRLGVAELTYREAVARGIAQEMERDERVVFLGEDVAKAGGVFKATVGLLREIRATARARYADLRTGDPRRRDGRRDDGTAADRGNHVLRLPRRMLRLRRK